MAGAVMSDIGSDNGRGINSGCTIRCVNTKWSAIRIMSRPTSDRPTILVADDDEFAREWACEIVRSLDVDVISACDGAEAIDQLEHTTGAAIVDLNMPRATGLEVLSIASRRCPGLPVLLLSGAGEIEDAVAALKHGA